MAKIAVYAGSFNPWHEGHQDILDRALEIFDKVIVLQGHNPSKPEAKDKSFFDVASSRVECGFFNGLLADALKEIKPNALIRGLRNGYDLQYEMNLQYWNEDLGLKCPVVYFVTDRKFGHISSSAIREITQARLGATP